ncbi:MAG: murein biosynthesis integral membrane protein MurJ [Chloroflexi bacterium]|nr:murein biosynthesis integral membrane protein MurJ [Chloroflexota bacterium]
MRKEAQVKIALPLGRVVSFATITAAGFVLGRISGIGREMVISAHFGLSSDLDAYLLAVLVPTLINNIIAGSAITAAVMPTFGRYLAEGRRDEFWRAASTITNVVLLITGGVTLLGMLLAAPIISLLGGDLPPATGSLATALLVIMMPTLFLGAALNMLMAVLNSLDHFVGPALIFLALNVGMILVVIILTPYVGIYAVAWGFLAGCALQVIIQFVELRRENPWYSFSVDWHHPVLRQTVIAFLPITALALVAQINTLVDRTMATALPAGSISALSYADTILGSFYMLGISLGIAIFPGLSRLAAAQDLENTARTIVASLRILIFILAPLSLLVIPFAAPIVGVILGRGKFDATAVDMTAQAMAMYAIGLIATAALYVLQRAFYALSDNMTPFVVGLLAAGLHIGLNLVFMRSWAHAGIALSASITAIVTVVALVLLLARRVHGLQLGSLLGFLAQCAALSLACTLLADGAFSFFRLPVGTTPTWVAGVAFAGAGGLAYLLTAMALRWPEGHMLLQTGLGFVRRK